MKTVETAGGRLACWDAGRGPALVAIHGASTPGELLRIDLGALGRSCRVITYDRRGYGESSPPAGGWADHRDDAAELIEQLGVEPATLFGYGVGAAIALAVAIARPELVAALVLLDPLGFADHAFDARLARERAKLALTRRLRGERAGAERWMHYLSTYSTGGSAWDKAVPERRERILANAAGILADIDAGDAEPLLEPARLAALDRPVTVVETTLSPPFVRRSVARARELLPQARTITLEGSSHIALLDARDRTLELLRAATGAEPPSRAD